MKGQKSQWEIAQDFERNWWNSCANTVWEDVKQMNLAKYLGLEIVPNAYTNYRIPLEGQSVLDIGGGPSSLLLKCENRGRSAVIDPCFYPDWVGKRYVDSGIEYHRVKGEELEKILNLGKFDEIWIYNVLQHTENPELVIKNAQRVGKIIRLFEWINTGVNEGHLHSFTKAQLEGWLRGSGRVVNLSDEGLYGTAFYGIFLGDSYDSKAEREV